VTRRRYTAVEREVAIAAYRAGLSLNEAAASLDIPASTIRYWLRSAGMPLRLKESARLARVREGLHGTVAEHADQLRRGRLGDTHNEAARSIGASPTGVARWMDE
jgi:transposase-like protein